RPVREKSPETLNAQAKCLYASSGYEEISLTSLSISDYTGIAPLTEQLLSWTTDNMVNLSLPSLRVDNFPKELMERITSVRATSLTFAPEAGTQRLRDVINKNVTREDLMKAVNVAFDGGKTSVKLYFMEGLPTETLEDLDGIAEMAQSVVHEYYQNPNRQKGRSPSVTISVACFVPKPFTPFQWEAQDTLETLREKQDYLFHKITDRKVRYDHHDARTSVIEGVLARGDRKLCGALLRAHEKGFRYDAWTEHFDYDKWLEVFAETGIDPAFYASRRRDPSEVLPWDIIDIGVAKAFLNREREKAYEAATTPNCAEQCSGCGANRLGGNSPYCPGCNAASGAKNAVETLPDTARFDELVKKFDFPQLASPKTMRVKFRKVGSLQYISHLDLHRTFNRVLVRAGIPLWYTQGFNPHAKMVFALPLSVGTESECEYLDVRVDRDISPDEMKKRLNACLTDELRVLDVYEAKTKPTGVMFASYHYAICPDQNGEALFGAIRELFRAPVIMKKKTKSGEKEIDILPLIRSLTVEYDPETRVIDMDAMLSAAGESYLNPEYLITAIKARTGFLAENAGGTYRIVRTGMYLEDGKTEFV
ncbi:MAG: TIGR03960 family B12-binding radical SAM protein, partial [Clostridia bacterium]|nr:TIGR03960 family B12-binding radical SAM protein [Clostridia bacterium]